jgi:hypothetical protein
LLRENNKTLYKDEEDAEDKEDEEIFYPLYPLHPLHPCKVSSFSLRLCGFAREKLSRKAAKNAKKIKFF